MNEEIEYAEMLEIPVSTVNVVRKNRKKKKAQEHAFSQTPPLSQHEFPHKKGDLKDSLIARVNEKMEEETTPLSTEALPAPTEQTDGKLDFNDVPDRIDTVRLYSAEDTENFGSELFSTNSQEGDIFENEGGRYALNYKKRTPKAVQRILKAEFAAACVLCGAIFLTNAFVPKSAINTFFRALATTPAVEETDNRLYSDFTLSPIVSELSDAELTLSATGILSFTDDCCVYPAADGNVLSVTQQADGSYTMRLEHSDSFTATISGLDHVYYGVGEDVKANVPLGYSLGEKEVQVTMYSGETLLNCLQITETNGLAWMDANAEIQDETQI